MTLECVDPTYWIDYQEIRVVRDAHRTPMLLCSGIAELPTAWSRVYELGGFALVEPGTGRPYHECPFPEFTPKGRHVATRNAVHAELDGDTLWLYVVADDDEDAALLVYRTYVG